MPSLASKLRKELETAVKQARRAAETGAGKALDLLAVGHHEPWGSMKDPEKRRLRNRLRAHGVQLGDVRDSQRGTQAVTRLTGEVAYEHWHRMLFARYLAENELLIEPESGQAMSMDECRELAREQGKDWIPVACAFAEAMLPEIFRRGLPAPHPRSGEFCIYVHKCSDDSFYIGQTDDFARRRKEHEQGKVEWTAPRLPIEPIHWEVFPTRMAAVEREKELKTGFGRQWLKREYERGRLAAAVRQAGDPVLEVALPPETRSELEDVLNDLPRDVFVASDSLGWVYQFWQAERKDEVNASGNKIGADELPSVTQLFTEDYMVGFLLDNTLGAWWAGKQQALNPQLSALNSEVELRQAIALPGCPWNYLRFIKSKDGKWTPAAGTFEGWPKAAKELRCIDPCMGSGHFVVAMFERLLALRMAEEKIDEASAVAAVIRDNLFGLEIDPRCTQIGAFNLALAAWRRVGYRPLPAMNLACSGLAPNTSEADWLKIAGGHGNIQNGMSRLYRLFKNAPVLGSLINPRVAENELLESAFHELQPLLEKALAKEANDDTAHEMAVTARGLAKAAEILAGQFTLVATNVPYLLARKQCPLLKEWCDRYHADAKADLATAFVERGLGFAATGGSVALVTPQNWLYLGSSKKLREALLKNASWNVVARLGPGAFETIGGEVVNVALLAITNQLPAVVAQLAGLDAAEEESPAEKGAALSEKPLMIIPQDAQLQNPDARILVGEGSSLPLLEKYSIALNGMHGGDAQRFRFFFWEICDWQMWTPFQGTCESTMPYSGREHVFFWPEDGKIHHENPQAFVKGYAAWGKRGVVVNMMGQLPASLYSGEKFDISCTPIVPHDTDNLAAIWAFCSSLDFSLSVRQIDQSLKVTNATLAKIPFDLAHWQKVAAEKYPHGLPKPFSSDAKQWLFNGHPQGADQPLHVAVARLLGYQWPRQTGSSFPDCPALKGDSLDRLPDKDGIVCLSATKGEAPAGERLNALLSAAFGSEWSATKARDLLAATDSDAKTLAEWLSEDFFAQHCDLFHQRPFIWHIWDGLKGGFSALVNYHRLAAGDGAGKRTLEKLIYTYLGDWIDAQRKAQKAEIEGADARLTAAEHLRRQLEAILTGEPPFDLFVRWKPLHEQPIGWNPDINDGVRLNIRPFITAKPLNARGKNACILRATPKVSWGKDRGKEPQRAKADFPWFWTWDEATADFKGGSAFDGNRWNDCHYSNAAKQAARERREQRS